MNIYLLTQNDNIGYDTYDGIVVIAKDEEQARNIHPYEVWGGIGSDTWAKSPNNVTAILVGRALENATAGITILESFRAG